MQSRSRSVRRVAEELETESAMEYNRERDEPIPLALAVRFEALCSRHFGAWIALRRNLFGPVRNFK